MHGHSNIKFNRELCLYVATNFLCILIFCPKLRLYLVLLLSLCLLYNPLNCLLLFVYKWQWCVILQHLPPNSHPYLLVVYPVLTNEAMTTESLRYNSFISNWGSTIPKHACPEAKGSKPTIGLTLLWACNPFRANSNYCSVSQEAGRIIPQNDTV